MRIAEWLVKRGLLGCALALYAAQASAQLYAGAGFGPTDFEDDVVLGLIDSGTVDTTDTGWKAFAGFHVHPNFALEAGYVDLGEVTYAGTFGGDTVSDGRIEATGVSLAPVAVLPITPAFEVFGKLGLLVWEAEAKDVIAGTRSSIEEDGTDVFFGAGLTYGFTRNVAARAEYELFRLEDVDASLLSVSLVFRF